MGMTDMERGIREGGLAGVRASGAGVPGPEFPDAGTPALRVEVEEDGDLQAMEIFNRLVASAGCPP